MQTHFPTNLPPPTVPYYITSTHHLIPFPNRFTVLVNTEVPPLHHHPTLFFFLSFSVFSCTISLEIRLLSKGTKTNRQVTKCAKLGIRIVVRTRLLEGMFEERENILESRGMKGRGTSVPSVDALDTDNNPKRS